MHQLCKLHWIFMVEFCWTEELKSDQRQFHFIQLRTNLKANSKTRSTQSWIEEKHLRTCRSSCVRSVSGVSECVRSVAGDVPCQYNYDDHFIIPQLAGGWPCCQHFSLPRHPRADQPGCYQDGCQINKHLTSTSTQLNGTSLRCGSISSSGSVS